MRTKRCGRCGVDKSLKSFNLCKTGRLGRHNHCRYCQRVYRKRYYERNATAARTYSRAYRKTEKAIRERRENYIKRRDVLLARNRKYRNTPEARRKANIARRRLYVTDLSFRLTVNLRVRVRKALAGISKSASTLNLLGCTLEEFKAHLKRQFKPGMLWSNYGYRGWHVDHIIPCASFDLSDPDQQLACFHYSNMRPTWRFDNQSRGCKFLSRTAWAIGR